MATQPDVLVLATDRPATPADVPGGVRVEVWRPTWRAVRPAGAPLLPAVVWWMFHCARLFGNRDYAVIVVRAGGVAVHRASVFPPYFRFPFMCRHDVQVGATWTEPAHRGRGYARLALEAAVREFAAHDRRLWYLVEESNEASVRVAERAGLRRVGRAVRTAPGGVRLLGQFVLVSAAA